MKKSFFRLSLVGLIIIALASCEKDKTQKLTISVANVEYASEVDEAEAYMFQDVGNDYIEASLGRAPLKNGKFDFELPLKIEKSLLISVSEYLSESTVRISNKKNHGRYG